LQSCRNEAIRAGEATLAEICRREFGVPARIANVEQRAVRIAE
jgi:2-aminoadipate transaminase